MDKNTLVVKASRLTRFNRFDAEFHLAVDSVGDRPELLSCLLTKEEVLRRLGLFKDSDLSALLPIATGVARNVHVAYEKYPFIAYALIERALPRLMAKRQQVVSDALDYANMLECCFPARSFE